MLNGMLRDLASCRSLQAIFGRVKLCLKELYQCQTVTVLLHFPRLCDLYKAERGSSTMNFDLLKEKFLAVIHSAKDV
jgi:hypothetical protein